MSLPTAWYVNFGNGTSTGYYAVAQWAATTAYSVGNLVRQLATPAVNSERVFVCIVAGTSGGSEPTWVLTKGAKTTDNTVTWMEVTGQPAVNGDTGLSLTTNGSTASGGNVLNFASTTGVAVGMYAFGANLSFTSSLGVVTEVTGTQVTISVVTTGAIGSGATVYFAYQQCWQRSLAVALGILIYDQVSGSLQICTTAGTTGTTDPTFSAVAGATKADNTATWTSLGAPSAFSAWAAPHARITNALTSTWAAAGNVIFVGDNHAETQASALAIASLTGSNSTNLNNVLCVDHTAAVPPGTANLKTTATVTTTGASNLSVNGAIYVDGISFSCGTSGSPVLAVQATNAQLFMRMDNCALILGSGTTGGSIQLTSAASGAACKIDFNNVTVQFAAAAQSIQPRVGTTTWRNTPNAISGTSPTNLFTGGESFILIVDGVDLSGATGSLFPGGASAGNFVASFYNCKFASGVTVIAITQAISYFINVINCDSAGTNYQQQRYGFLGNQTESTSIVRTGGATAPDGTAISWAVTTNSQATWTEPYESFPIALWNPRSGVNVTATVYGIWNSSILPNNDQLWFELAYMGSASSPLASLATATKANYLAPGVALAADSNSRWDSLVASRANSNAYTVGNVIKVPDNPGRIFFCTANGTSAGSEPAAYATAVDGQSITDGTATFQAGVRFSMSITLSSPQPAMVGALYGAIKAGLASSLFYVDPVLNMS